MLEPSTVAEAATMLAECGGRQQAVRPVGTGSRAGWGGVDQGPVLDVHSTRLDRVVEHNPGDFTAVLEAGVPLARAQDAFRTAGQWLAIDPAEPGGTIGGLVATADSGPVRHRYGAMRDLVIGITVVLSDGTVASAGGKVIKNVAGYDLGKLFTGSYGTLGLISSVAVRLHPRPASTVTLSGTTDDPDQLGRIAVELAGRPLEALCLDAWWEAGTGGLLVRFGGVAPAEQADRIRPMLAGLDGVSAVSDDDALWAAQRARQRRADGAVVKVSARPTDLPEVITAAHTGGASVVSRAGLGLCWLAFAGDHALAARVAAARRALAPHASTVLDGGGVIADPWPAGEPGVLAVMRRIKARFDPARIFRPGAYIGGI
jgi:glycolate oxidase FAD binding subunit